MPEPMTAITRACPSCGMEATLLIRVDGYREWQRGALIQDAFPELSDSEREFLLSGYCDDCWDEDFGD